MAATKPLVYCDESKIGLASETFAVDFGGDTSIEITPTEIKEITGVVIVATNAAGTGSETLYADGFVAGSPTVTVAASDNTATCLVNIEGIIA